MNERRHIDNRLSAPKTGRVRRGSKDQLWYVDCYLCRASQLGATREAAILSHNEHVLAIHSDRA